MMHGPARIITWLPTLVFAWGAWETAVEGDIALTIAYGVLAIAADMGRRAA